jgi:hypothetical protein
MIKKNFNLNSLIKESVVNYLIESKKTKSEAINFLKKGGISEEDAETIANQFHDKDKSDNQKLTPFMALYYSLEQNPNANEIVDVFIKYNDLLSRNMVSMPTYVNNKIMVANSDYTDLEKLKTLINTKFDVLKKKEQGKKTEIEKDEKISQIVTEFKPNKKPLFSGDKIDLYRVSNERDAICYSNGGLTDKSYTFCIGQYGNVNYKNYRQSTESTFYYIVDRNYFKVDSNGSPNLDDPRHVVVYELKKFDGKYKEVFYDTTNNGYGSVMGYGSGTEGFNEDEYVVKYKEYLKSKGVDIDKLKKDGIITHMEMSDKERATLDKVAKQNKSVSWLKSLTGDELLSYIGRGHVLSDEQYEYLMTNNINLKLDLD